MSDPLVPAAVDAALAASEPKVTISAAELARLQSAAGDRETIERASASTLIETTLSLALAGSAIVHGAAPHLARLLRDDFEAKYAGGKWTVVGKDGRPLEDVVRDRLTSPEFAIYRPGVNRGGAPSSRLSPPSPDAIRGDRLTPVQKIAANIKYVQERHKGRGLPTAG